MNDISESISAGEVHLYADDITAFVIGATTDETIYKMQVLAKEVTQWCRINKMTVNTKKTEAMIVQSRKFIGPLLPVEIADNVVDYKEECKLLGVFIDRQLKWKTQIEKVRKKYTTYNAILKKINFLPSETLEKIYYSMIIPKITYGLLIWGTSSKNLMQKTETQHIKATRIVKRTGIKVKDIDVLQSVNWNRIDYIYKRKVATEMHKIVKGTEGHRLSDMFETKVSKRRGLKLQVKRLNTESERNTLNYRGTIVWNSLTTDVKNASSK